MLYSNGRYYDPFTGRFLSPDNSNFDPMRPGTLNGYLAALFLANPGGLFFGPLLILNWRRRKGSKGTYTVLLLVGVGLGITLAGCGGAGTGTPGATPNAGEIATGASVATTPEPAPSATSAPPTGTPLPPAATLTPQPTTELPDCPTPITALPTPTQTALPTSTPYNTPVPVDIPPPQFYSCQETGNKVCLRPEHISSIEGKIDAITHTVFGEGGSLSYQMAANVLQTLNNKAKVYWNCWKEAQCSSHEWINDDSQIPWEQITVEQYTALLLFISSEDSGNGWPAYNAWRVAHEHGEGNWNVIRAATKNLVMSAGQVPIVLVSGIGEVRPSPAISSDTSVYRFFSGSSLPSDSDAYVDFDEVILKDGTTIYQWYYRP